MSSSTELDAITVQFKTNPEDMPRISTSSSKLNYTSLKIFQEGIDANAMTTTSDTTELSHLELTQSADEMYIANGDVAFTTLTNPANTPTTPAHIDTHASTVALLLNPNATAETTGTYLDQESQCLFKEKQHQFNRYRNAKKSS